MADDLPQRYVDRFFAVLMQDDEVEAFEQQVKAQKPNATSEDIYEALLTCAGFLPTEHPREELLADVVGELPA